MRRGIGFLSCPRCSSYGGLVGTPLKRKLVDDKGTGRCPKCKVDYDMEIAEFKIGDPCPRCNEIINQKKRSIWWCPKCQEER